MDQIWLHTKSDLTPKLVPIKSVAQVKQFYTPEDEKRLGQEVESPGNAVIRTLIQSQPISSQDRMTLAFYMGVMLMRVPARRRHAHSLIPGVLNDLVTGIRAQLTEYSRQPEVNGELVTRRLAELAQIEQEYLASPPVALVDQIRRPWPTDRVVQAIFDMTWRVLVTKSEAFITTDNPVFFFRSLGLATPESELVFPLSSHYALHGSWQGLPRTITFLEAQTPLVREINRRMFQSADSLCFSSKPQHWLRLSNPRRVDFVKRLRW